MSYLLNKEEILITQLGEEGVAFNSTTNEYFSLNETSFKILKGIENQLSLEEIGNQLEKEYAISTTECEQAVDSTIKLFLSKKLIFEA